MCYAKTFNHSKGIFNIISSIFIRLTQRERESSQAQNLLNRQILMKVLRHKTRNRHIIMQVFMLETACNDPNFLNLELKNSFKGAYILLSE